MSAYRPRSKPGVSRGAASFHRAKSGWASRMASTRPRRAGGSWSYAADATVMCPDGFQANAGLAATRKHRITSRRRKAGGIARAS